MPRSRNVSVSKSVLRKPTVSTTKSLITRRIGASSSAASAADSAPDSETPFLHEWGNEPYGSEQWRLWWHAKYDPINAAKSQAESMMKEWIGAQTGGPESIPAQMLGGGQTSSFSLSSIPSYVWIGLAVIGGIILLKSFRGSR
jgi:hypothetical protein